MAAATESLTQQALERLLARLSPDRDAAGREYEAIRKRLIEFFDRRGVPVADALADQTLDRVSRKIVEGLVVDNARAYCYGVGKRVFLEWQKVRARETEAQPGAPGLEAAGERAEEAERRVSCLERCLGDLPPASRQLIMAYHQGDGSGQVAARKHLAEAFSVTSSALKTRACRIRGQLEVCLKRCLEGPRNL